MAVLNPLDSPLLMVQLAQLRSASLDAVQEGVTVPFHVERALMATETLLHKEAEMVLAPQ